MAQEYLLRYAESLLAGQSDVLLANEYSPEALVKRLARRKPSHGTLMADEAGRVLATMRQQKYGEALKDLLARLWDSPDRYVRELSHDSFALTNVYVNVCFATTQSRFEEVVQAEDISSGFLARFFPVVVTAPGQVL